MAGERTMWLVWHPDIPSACTGNSEENAWLALLGYDPWESQRADRKAAGWRCSQITVKEADDE